MIENTVLQQRAINKLSRLKVGALFMEMGTGKTKVALDLAASKRKKCDLFLYICPCSVKAEIEQNRAERGQNEEMQVPDRALTHQEKVEAFLDQALRPNPTKEQQQTQNPTEGRIARSRQSEPSSKRKSPTVRDASEEPEKRPSVKKQLDEIRKEQKNKAGNSRTNQRQPVNEHKAPKKKRNRSKRVR